MSKPPVHALQPDSVQADAERRPRGVVVQLPFAVDRGSRPQRLPDIETPEPVDAQAEPETHIHYIRENLQFLLTTFEQLLEPLRAVRDAGPDGLDATQWAELQAQVRRDLSFFDSEVPTAIRESLEGMAEVAAHVQSDQRRTRSPS